MVVVVVVVRETSVTHLGHESARVGPAADAAGARRLVDVDHKRHQARQGKIQPCRRQHPGRVRAGAGAGVPEFLRRVGEPVRLRALEQDLATGGDGLTEQEANVPPLRELVVVHHVLVVAAPGNI